jgi:hypothetical protein
MIKYAKIINQETKAVEVGLGTNVEFYKSLGMIPMEVEQAWDGNWYVAGYAPAKPEPTHDEKVEELKRQLKEIDTKSARSMRAILANVATENDRTFLANLEQQAESLRQQIKDLGGSL